MPMVMIDTKEAGLKIQKLIASTGEASRRHAEELIAEGRVRVDGKLAMIGQRISATSFVTIDGKRLRTAAGERLQPQMIAYNKPRGQIVSRTGEDTVFSNLPRLRNGRWVNVGRLDVESEGLMLFTNDGDLANMLAHPRYKRQRCYQVKSHAALDERSMAKVVQPGIKVAGKLVQADSFIKLARSGKATHWYEIRIAEGRNRVVRRIFAHFEADVLRLTRTSYGKYKLARNHAAGTWKKVPLPEVAR